VDKTVVKAFAVLELLVKAGRPSALSELAAAARLQKSNVHRLLSTLMALGYARQVESSLYEPSLRIWEIGQQIYGGFGIVRAALPSMRRLVDKTGETAHLAMLDQGEVVYLHKIESPNPVRAYTVTGGRAPAYCTASGKALLAYQEATVVAAVARGIKVFTPATVTNVVKLREELTLVRRRGFATNLGEFRANVAGLAAPVRNGQGEVIAAVGIAGPLERLRPRKVNSFAPVVIELAAEISAMLGAPSAR
jgi:DNA-binding IclR family transcriptional regulator